LVASRRERPTAWVGCCIPAAWRGSPLRAGDVRWRASRRSHLASRGVYARRMTARTARRRAPPALLACGAMLETRLPLLLALRRLYNSRLRTLYYRCFTRASSAT